MTHGNASIVAALGLVSIDILRLGVSLWLAASRLVSLWGPCLDVQIAKSQSQRLQIVIKSCRFEIAERSAKLQPNRL